MSVYSKIKVYLASPFESRDVMLAAKAYFELRGAEVTSTWLTPEDGNDNNMASLQNRFEDCRCRAVKDIQDIDAADVVVIYKPKEIHRVPTTGGHHVETGYALGTGKPVFIVGDRENVFHYLPTVRVLPSFSIVADALHLTEVAGAL